MINIMNAYNLAMEDYRNRSYHICNDVDVLGY